MAPRSRVECVGPLQPAPLSSAGRFAETHVKSPLLGKKAVVHCVRKPAHPTYHCFFTVTHPTRARSAKAAHSPVVLQVRGGEISITDSGDSGESLYSRLSVTPYRHYLGNIQRRRQYQPFAADIVCGAECCQGNAGTALPIIDTSPPPLSPEPVLKISPPRNWITTREWAGLAERQANPFPA